ncbi:MAG TPA: cation diffusion facilitator family transporter [Cyclobacteriaceae bacterium]|nr:cation diffusion facilitator family transporter [Cyclobacteriaceae bacterium]HMV10338.1 cation diffusion facilitator family transporter [Cyclobacteriaceae bacterium]HMV89866.1 cation diffusion facilitator family transporter [Cyclobacteriaceae bacterium]HMX02755.1 cation diffusion facilitator family transporter [Cyclobacteriaceae bacterium]HMX50091.1 cation diffusion facilitator family transporter [Cyclobacteriaceae bacterium]
MGHHHHHGHDHAHDHHHSTDNIKLAFWLNLGFALLEFVGGLYTNSVAVLSDSLHDLGDSLSLGTSWYFQKKAQKHRDQHFTYGYRRFSLLGAFINSIVLTVGSIFIIAESVERIVSPAQPDAKGMLILAVIGIGVNLLAMLRLKKGKSINERVISLHFLEDVLGWAAVLVGSVVMMFYNVPILDPLLSLGIAAFILFNVYRNMKSVFQIVLQGVPENMSEEKIKETVASLPEVKGLHDIHVWSMDGNYNIVTLHVVVSNTLTVDQREALKTRIKETLGKMSLQHTTVELETEGYPCAKPEV